MLAGALTSLCGIAFVFWLMQLNKQLPEYEVSDSVVLHSERDNGDSQDNAGALPEEFSIGVVYSPGYLIDLGGLERLHPFDIRKYAKIHKELVSDGLLTDELTIKPPLVTTDELLLVHSSQYLRDLEDHAKVARYLESGVLQFAPISLDRVVDPFKRSTGGTIVAARQALNSGIGINIGGGYHHAKPDVGEGFCLFADVPIAIRKLQNEGLIKRAVIIDVDVHQGNGTIVCLPDDDATFTFSMHQADIYPDPKEVGDLDVELQAGMGDEEFMDVLERHLTEVLVKADADICFVVGGCDPLAGDPLASLEMTPAGIVERDDLIVATCVSRKLPVVMTLSGGYSPEAWRSQYLSIKNLIEKYGLAK
jgi:histone deacetylase 11